MSKERKNLLESVSRTHGALTDLRNTVHSKLVVYADVWYRDDRIRGELQLLADELYKSLDSAEEQIIAGLGESDD